MGGSVGSGQPEEVADGESPIDSGDAAVAQDVAELWQPSPYRALRHADKEGAFLDGDVVLLAGVV